MPNARLRSLKNAWTGLETVALLAWLLLSGLVVAFLGLANEMREGELDAFDTHILQSLRQPGQPHLALGPIWLQESLRDVTALGSVTLIVLIMLIAALALVWHDRKRQAAVLVLLVPLSFLSNALIKALYGRPRPGFVLAGMTSFSNSFPSGHTTVSTAAYLVLAVVLASLETRRNRRVLVMAIAGGICILIGLSRVYLGMHWPSDVVAGWMLGSFWALLSVPLSRERRV